MASQFSTLATAQIVDGLSAATPARASDIGKVMAIVDSYTTTSAVTTAQTITLCKLPKGAKVFRVALVVPASVGTSASKIGLYAIAADGSLGTAIDDDRYGASKDLSSAGVVEFLAASTDFDYTVTQEAALVLQPTTTTFATAITFTFIVTYIVGN